MGGSSSEQSTELSLSVAAEAPSHCLVCPQLTSCLRADRGLVATATALATSGQLAVPGTSEQWQELSLSVAAESWSPYLSWQPLTTCLGATRFLVATATALSGWLAASIGTE